MRVSTLSWKSMSEPEWVSLCGDGKVIEHGIHGVKVLRCSNGDYIKVFRIKRRFTLAQIFNPAREFCKKVEGLQQRGIATLEPTNLYRFTHVPRWAVRYRPLQGETVRGLMQSSQLTPALITQLGQYIAQLHQKGIYFRSLHPGNIVLQPNGQFGLIDVLDCRFRFFHRPLNQWQRERNFQHFFRYEDGGKIEKELREAYEASSGK